MRDETEERRRQDLRDLEFYRQRLKPTASDLWRIVKGPPASPPVISEPRMMQRNVGEAERAEIDPARPGSTDSCKTSAGRPDTDAVWPLVAALIVLVALGLSGQIDRIPQALLF